MHEVGVGMTGGGKAGSIAAGGRRLEVGRKLRGFRGFGWPNSRVAWVGGYGAGSHSSSQLAWAADGDKGIAVFVMRWPGLEESLGVRFCGQERSTTTVLPPYRHTNLQVTVR